MGLSWSISPCYITRIIFERSRKALSLSNLFLLNSSKLISMKLCRGTYKDLNCKGNLYGTLYINS